MIIEHPAQQLVYKAMLRVTTKDACTRQPNKAKVSKEQHGRFHHRAAAAG
jgi:hypothetical protein